jgi:hypothetical protein
VTVDTSYLDVSHPTNYLTGSPPRAVDRTCTCRGLYRNNNCACSCKGCLDYSGCWASAGDAYLCGACS